MHNLTAQKVCLALITLGFFIVAPWMTSQTIGGNTTPLLSFLGVAFLIIIHMKRFARPFMTFNSKMIVCFQSKCAVTITGFQYSLRKRNTCRYSADQHFLHRSHVALARRPQAL